MLEIIVYNCSLFILVLCSSFLKCFVHILLLVRYLIDIVNENKIRSLIWYWEALNRFQLISREAIHCELSCLKNLDQGKNNNFYILNNKYILNIRTIYFYKTKRNKGNLRNLTTSKRKLHCRFIRIINLYSFNKCITNNYVFYVTKFRKFTTLYLLESFVFFNMSNSYFP